jgi:hypothetical protein
MLQGKQSFKYIQPPSRTVEGAMEYSIEIRSTRVDSKFGFFSTPTERKVR